jgi:hypothetical protein
MFPEEGSFGQFYSNLFDRDIYSLELPWRDNQRLISCIPPGVYPMTRGISSRLGLIYSVHDVPNRTSIEMHSGDFIWNTHGCILCAFSQADINSDGWLDNYKSKPAMKFLWHLNFSQLTIKIRP